MGRSTQAKNDKADLARERFKASLASASAGHAQRAAASGDALAAKARALVEPFLSQAFRPIETFRSKTRSARLDKRALELARHLFSKHAVPPILWQAWAGEPARGASADHRAWFVAVGLGASFHKSCSKGMLTRREAHLFLTCRHDLGIEQALRWAVARAAGAADGMALRICRGKLSSLPFDDFWRAAARHFAAHVPASVQECSDLCDYLEWRRREDPAFQVHGNGFTAESIRARMLAWHRDLARAKALGDARWEGSPMADWSQEIPRGDGEAPMHWSATQILGSKALAAEGNAMRHCVLSYKHACVSGRCSIWSFRCGWGPDPATHERKLTIELDADGRVAQARGLANRMPRPDEARAMRSWAIARGVDLRS